MLRKGAESAVSVERVGYQILYFASGSCGDDDGLVHRLKPDGSNQRSPRVGCFVKTFLREEVSDLGLAGGCFRKEPNHRVVYSVSSDGKGESRPLGDSVSQGAATWAVQVPGMLARHIMLFVAKLMISIARQCSPRERAFPKRDGNEAEPSSYNAKDEPDREPANDVLGRRAGR